MIWFVSLKVLFLRLIRIMIVLRGREENLINLSAPRNCFQLLGGVNVFIHCTSADELLGNFVMINAIDFFLYN